MDKEVIDIVNEKSEKALSFLRDEMNTVRAGKANPALLDRIIIDYYGTPSPLKNIANISAPDPRTLQITPFDPSTVSLIEKAIQIADLGINPSNDGKNIRLAIPQVTEERRKELTKVVKKMGEEAKIILRNFRREANDTIKKQEKEKEITEDDLKTELDEIQKITDKFIKEVDDIIEAKEKEIMEV
ncbi:MAG: ribosome recycling factor [Anaerovoracaceae bacterium]|nr:ribosome recycling factor [Clostridiales bacterium]